MVLLMALPMVLQMARLKVWPMLMVQTARAVQMVLEARTFQPGNLSQYLNQPMQRVRHLLKADRMTLLFKLALMELKMVLQRLRARQK